MDMDYLIEIEVEHDSGKSPRYKNWQKKAFLN